MIFINSYFVLVDLYFFDFLAQIVLIIGGKKGILMNLADNLFIC